MFINSNNQSKTNPNCKECENISICKYIKDKLAIEDKLKTIKHSLPVLSPIQINITCNQYRKKFDKENTYYREV